MFAQFFVEAFEDSGADADQNGRVSIWEAFSYASAAVKKWYEGQDRLPTERALLDDTGAGAGREATAEGQDGELARSTYLEPDRVTGRLGDANLARLGWRLRGQNSPTSTRALARR